MPILGYTLLRFFCLLLPGLFSGCGFFLSFFCCFFGLIMLKLFEAYAD